MLELKNVHAYYQDKEILSDISINFKDKQRVCILGESGVGKTTLLSLLMGKIKHTGTLKNTFNNISIVYQKDGLFKWLTVYENLKITKPDVKEEVIDKYLIEFNLLDQKDSFIDNISTGQAQRVQIIRALLANSDLILLDEPSSALDVNNKEIFNKYLVKNVDNYIYVTHDVQEACLIADRIIILKDKKIVEDIKNIESSKRNLDNEDFYKHIISIRSKL